MAGAERVAVFRDSVTGSVGRLSDVGPGGDVCLTVAVIAHGRRRAVGFQTRGVIHTGGHGDDAGPGGDDIEPSKPVSRAPHRPSREPA